MPDPAVGAERRTGTPEFVYASSREEAQRLLDESYLAKFRAVPIDEWAALVADRDAQRQEIEGANVALAVLREGVAIEKDRADKAVADRDALQHALEEIADGTTPDRIGRYEYLRDWVHKTAIAALPETTEDNL